MIYRVLYISGGAGFLPSTVVQALIYDFQARIGSLFAPSACPSLILFMFLCLRFLHLGAAVCL